MKKLTKLFAAFALAALAGTTTTWAASTYTFKIPIHGLDITSSAPAVSGDPYFSSVTALDHFDGADGSTSFTDQTGQALSVYQGAPTISTAQSKFGGSSVYFPGNSCLQEPYSSGIVFNGDFTVEFWVNYSSFTGYGGLVTGASSGAMSGWQVIWNGNSSNLRLETSGGSMNTVATLSPNTWYDVALVRHNGAMQFYINGVADPSTLTYSGTLDSGGGSLHIGCERNGTAWTTGYIDEVRITNGVARYTTNYTPATAEFPNS
jgi:hypothetical protein